jgi:cytochrome c1
VVKRKVIVFTGMVLFLVSCSQNEPKSEAPAETASAIPTVAPAVYLKGKELYRNHCAPCHGEKGVGTHRGPSFLSHIYHPNHHGDESFILAVRNGARAHHWQFGDMPPISHVNEDEVREIVAYIRWLQRENHIY